MIFDIITIFPDIFKSYFKESIIGRAQKRKLVKINIYNLRDFAYDRHKTVDDKPYGGGAGMVFKVEPIYRAVSKIKKRIGKNKKTKVILFSAKGKKFDQKLAKKFSKLDELILICGRYEGVDERVARHIADMEISVGDYILTGGEIPAMILVDAITRLIPGAIKEKSLKEESFSSLKIENCLPPVSLRSPSGRCPKGTEMSQRNRDVPKGQKLKIGYEYPQYTRPEVFSPKRGVYWRVPKILLSGNHKKIEGWKKNHIK